MNIKVKRDADVQRPFFVVALIQLKLKSKKNMTHKPKPSKT